MDWPGARAEKTLRRMVSRKLELFKPFPDLYSRSGDDLFQIAFLAALKAWPGYNASKGHWSTYVYTVGWRSICDVLRSRCDEARRQVLVAYETADAADREDGLPGGLGGDADTLEDWAGIAYRRLTHLLPVHLEPRRRGRRWFSFAQRVTIAYVMRRYSFDDRKMAIVLAGNPELRAAIRLTRSPSRWTCWRSSKFLTETLTATRARQLDALRQAEPTVPNNGGDGKAKAKARAAARLAGQIQGQSAAGLGSDTADTPTRAREADRRDHARPFGYMAPGVPRGAARDGGYSLCV